MSFINGVSHNRRALEDSGEHGLQDDWLTKATTAAKSTLLFLILTGGGWASWGRVKWENGSGKWSWVFGVMRIQRKMVLLVESL
ncbi:hypothetical protein TIFTF001_054984 [Ficus carica]|uniref:Uncharacterized protein n=1 Tax=Ficus carica TaxID=3494 RepID=A0AA88EFY0_FICCA|nr:hypothetical protein TIFTF001_054974 [Ficus carica]GMN74172.1 hypothetical protein TIFTF001_054975 [Ficus carica]GMN74229.1 hypothetical protein TIFTF001_054983 [Ficus carica]GMN74235.1 hypothetical protein TIFTF001_054984 [Ficus carica]